MVVSVEALGSIQAENSSQSAGKKERGDPLP
jgi:hypothetical protein